MTLPDWDAAVLAVRWYPQPNDLIGGWCVCTVDMPPSRHSRDRADMEVEVASFMSLRVARHIADLHNVTLDPATPERP